MLVLVLVIWQALGLPEVEDPTPNRIGLEFIFGLAGAGGVLGGIVGFAASPAKRERAVSRGGLVGFCIGATVYCLSLLAQLLSSS
ncbi:MAG TPA: hypothetical protein VFN18_01515 [Solirubrobacterales bacterium]|nr:hypothetical protein [Solirubrobacterales bacterium]